MRPGFDCIAAPTGARDTFQAHRGVLPVGIAGIARRIAASPAGHDCRACSVSEPNGAAMPRLRRESPVIPSGSLVAQGRLALSELALLAQALVPAHNVRIEVLPTRRAIAPRHSPAHDIAVAPCPGSTVTMASRTSRSPIPRPAHPGRRGPLAVPLVFIVAPAAAPGRFTRAGALPLQAAQQGAMPR